jgi:hypothetical protein
MNILAYRTIPVTVLIATIYILIFLALYQTNSVPSIPEDTHGLDLEQAYVDLHHVSVDVGADEQVDEIEHGFGR